MKPIGAGAMGTVYLAQHVDTKERFALKQIRGQLADAEDLARFRREAEYVGRLHHPHVVRLRDCGSSGGTPYQVYELYEGGTLEDRLRQGPLSLDDAMEITRKLGDGLSHAHAHQILHRDIKPANVLFSTEGEPALADFGLARRSLGQSQGLTATGEAIGTPLYMSPEQAIDAKRIDARADLYGLAAVCYAMLSGHPPVVGTNTVLEAFDKVINEAPPPLERPDVPPAVERVLLEALAKDPDDRPRDVEAFVRLLVAAPTEVVRSSRLSRLAGFVALLLAIPLVAIALVTIRKSEESVAAPTPTQAAPGTPSSAPSEATPAPTPLEPLSRAASANLRDLVPTKSSWAWLTCRPAGEEIGVSLLITASWQDGSLSLVVPRARGAVEGEIWDTGWRSGPTNHLLGLVNLGQLATLSKSGEALTHKKLPRGVQLDGPSGDLLRACLEQGALAGLFRHLANSPPEPDGVRRVSRAEATFAWEPLLWAGWIGDSLAARKKLMREPPIRLHDKLINSLKLDPSLVRSSISESAWPLVLTHNRCRELEDKPFPQSEALAIPIVAPPQRSEPLGAIWIRERVGVFSQPSSLLLGITPPGVARYLVLDRRKGWLQITWGGGRGWIRGTEFTKETGPLLRVVNSSVNVRAKCHYFDQSTARLGPSPALGQIPQEGIYPFMGKLSGPEGAKPPRDTRWAQIRFDDRLAWVARTQGSERRVLVRIIDEDGSSIGEGK